MEFNTSNKTGGIRVRTSYAVQKTFLWLHHNLLAAIMGCYVLAAIMPWPGLFISRLHIGVIGSGEDALKLSVPFFLLSLLLLNSGLSVKQSELRNLRQQPQSLFLGVLFNFCLPLAVIFCLSKTMQGWHNQDELQNILVGLALVGAMPIAASSTAWTQKGDGNIALSLGLILVSTLFSPVTTPLALHFSGNLTTGDYSEDLHLLANGNANLFLILSVVVPSFIGLLLHFLIKEERANRLRDTLKELNLLILLVLNYFNASHVLPGILKSPDWDFLFLIVLVTTLLCIVAFGMGGLIGKLLGLDKASRRSLIFGLGMNNNGTGLVLASMTLSDHPLVMLPIIVYNLLQHIIAGLVDKLDDA